MEVAGNLTSEDAWSILQSAMIGRNQIKSRNLINPGFRLVQFQGISMEVAGNLTSEDAWSILQSAMIGRNQIKSSNLINPGF